MRSCWLAAPLALVLASPDSHELLAAEASLTASGSSAELVRAALEAELDGPSELRAQLLKEALERDPSFAPARWQSGFIRWDDQWLRPDEIARRVARDPQLAEYRKRRNALIDTADNHRQLARWCHSHHLPDQERVHWAKVLEFDASDSEALAGLKLQFYEGQLLTKAQIEQAKKQALEQKQATRTWQPKLAKWRTAIESGKQPQRSEALECASEDRRPAGDSRAAERARHVVQQD